MFFPLLLLPLLLNKVTEVLANTIKQEKINGTLYCEIWNFKCCHNIHKPQRALKTWLWVLLLSPGMFPHPPLSAWAAALHLILNLRAQFPASPWNYSNKPITSSHGNQQDPTPLLLPASHSLTAPSGSLCSWVQPSCGPTWNAVSSSLRLWVYVINCCQSHLSISHVVCSAIYYYLGWETPPSSTAWRGCGQNTCRSERKK